MEAAKLDKKSRDDLPDSDFAVPGKRVLPIHDATHVRMAWNMVDKTQGLTEEEKSKARKKILSRARKLGIDTADWNVKAEEDSTLKASDGNYLIKFNGMAVIFPDNLEDHPNKVPFSGVLTKLDEPSDAPLGGSNGKRVILPKEVAETSLGSLLGMAIDFTNDLSGHNAKQKIGLIQEANIVGNEIQIKGFFYGADFFTEVKRIQAETSRLGFSYEAQVNVKSMNDDPLVVESCVFTGAAVLYKDKAAYKTTSLIAKANEDNEMNKEILDALQEITARLEKIEANASNTNSIESIVKPHSDTLLAAADEMSKANIGLDAEQGHVRVIRDIAANMMEQASVGKMPTIYQTADWLKTSKSTMSGEGSGNVAASADMTALKNEISELKTQLADIKTAKFNASTPPNRSTSSAQGDAIKKENIGDKKAKSVDDYYKDAVKKFEAGDYRFRDETERLRYALQMYNENAEGDK